MSTSAETLDDLVPPAELLFDGTRDIATFKRNGEGFTRVNLIELAGLQPTERVLDVGSGNGQKARALAAYLNQRGSYEGFDVDASGVEWCQAHYARFANFRFQHANVYHGVYNKSGRVHDTSYRFPFADDEFDLVFLCSVFIHMLPDGIENYLHEIGRVLKPRGRCVASCYLINDESKDRLTAGQARRAFPHMKGFYRLQNDKNPYAAVALDESWLRDVLCDAGLRLSAAIFGEWSGGEGLRIGEQDLFVAVKTKAPTAG
jgi:SAM-dependent methyltransferase